MSSEQRSVAPRVELSNGLPLLGDYAVIAKIASGGMATVYLGRKRGVAGFERLVAIKCCHPHLRDNEEFAAMFLDEARLAAGIRHPNVVATLDVNDGEHLYLVMEYIEGTSLSSLVRHAAKSNTRLPAGVAIRVMTDMLAGLHAAHELRDADGRLVNLVHRDVSPQNVLVGADGMARITDFGIAFASERATHTQDGLIKGKFSYIAPEQVKGHVSRRMDIFSAGTVLWEALTGQPLFRRQDEASTLNAVLTQPIPAPSRLVPELPAEVDAVLLKALERAPEDRYATAAEFADALERLPVAGMTRRAVTEYVVAVFGPQIEGRRALVRNAPEQQPPTPVTNVTNADVTHSHVKPLPGVHRAAMGSDVPELSIHDGSAVTRATSAMPQSVSSPAPAESGSGNEFEHRRMRSVLAALMLLLVGSAVGLLLARSGGVGAQPASPNTAAPAQSTPDANSKPPESAP